jgi:hypothetical protein
MASGVGGTFLEISVAVNIFAHGGIFRAEGEAPMTAGIGKICLLCGKDVSGIKRIKDPQGNYYCEPCHTAALKGTPAAPVAAAPMSTGDDGELALKDDPPARAKPAVPASDELELKDEPVRPAKRPAAAVKAPAAEAAPKAAGPLQLPDRCPNCGVKVVIKSVYCVGCKRDMTKMDKLAEIVADAAKLEQSQKSGKIVAKTLGAIGAVVVLAILALFLYVEIRPYFGSGDPWEEYPTTREPLLRNFLGHINAGTEKDIDAAYNLISQRETGIQRNTEVMFKNNLRAWRDELNKAHGANWLAKAQIKIPPADKYLGDEVLAEVTIDKMVYHIGLQVQMSQTEAMSERRIPMKKKTPHMENGKWRWGIGQICEHELGELSEARMFRPGADVPDPDEKQWVPDM